MSRKYLYVFLVAAVLLTISELFPAWLYQDESSFIMYPAGYHWRFDPPRAPTDEDESFRIVGQEPVLEHQYIVGTGPRFTLAPAVHLRVLEHTSRRIGQDILILAATLGACLFLLNRLLFTALFLPGLLEIAPVLVVGYIFPQKLPDPAVVAFFPLFAGAACASVYFLRVAPFNRFWKTYLFSGASASLPWLILSIVGATISMDGTRGYFWLGLVMITVLVIISWIISLPVTYYFSKSELMRHSYDNTLTA